MHFRPRHPLRFTAGQHGLWVVPGGGVKPFTIASAPEDDLITLGTGLSSGSRFKRALGALEAGSKVRFVGPVGGFTLEGAGAAVVMLAQGMGVTPFRSMLRHVAISGADTRTTLIHLGARHPFRYDTAATVTAACYPTSREEFVRDAAAAAAQQRTRPSWSRDPRPSSARRPGCSPRCRCLRRRSRATGSTATSPARPRRSPCRSRPDPAHTRTGHRHVQDHHPPQDPRPLTRPP